MSKDKGKMSEIIAPIAAIIGICIAVIALIPAFGQWLNPRTPVQPVAPSSTPSPTTGEVSPIATNIVNTPLPTKIPIPPPLNSMISEKDGMILLYVPDGEFLMGSNSNSGYADEQPSHHVSLDTFRIDQTEVTNAMYANCVNAPNYGEKIFTNTLMTFMVIPPNFVLFSFLRLTQRRPGQATNSVPPKLELFNRTQNIFCPFDLTILS